MPGHAPPGAAAPGAGRLVAITREVSPAFARCELTHLPREAIDVGRARAQHAAYEACLERLGCKLHRLPADPALPDSVFVEDAALVFDECAVVTRPGALSRHGETTAVAEALASYRSLARIAPPATLDGGDVLRVGRRLFVGLSSRSNPAAVDQLRAILGPYGYEVRGIPVSRCLHLKSAVTALGPESVLLNRAWVHREPFGALRVIEVDPSEPHAANVLAIGDTLVAAAAFPRTNRRLCAAGLRVETVDVSEIAKAEGAVTCCSLVVPLT